VISVNNEEDITHLDDSSVLALVTVVHAASKMDISPSPARYIDRSWRR
jgi:hypothetical protein